MISGLLLCGFSALLEVEQPLRLHPTGIAQACDVDPRRERDAPLVEDIPPYLVGACGLGLIHQRAYRLPQHIVDHQLHRTGAGQVVGYQGGAVERVGKVGCQTTNFRHCVDHGLGCGQWFDAYDPHSAAQRQFQDLALIAG